MQPLRNESTTNHESIGVNVYTTNHEPASVPAPANENNNHGQESIPIANDEGLSLQELKQEIQDLRQIILKKL